LTPTRVAVALIATVPLLTKQERLGAVLDAPTVIVVAVSNVVVLGTRLMMFGAATNRQ